MACIGILLIPENYLFGLTISIFAYTLIGIGVGASGTSLLAFLATRTDNSKKAAAATITWIMMIFGAAFTAIFVGKIIDPYSIEKLLKIGCNGAIVGKAIYEQEISLTDLSNDY